MARLLWTLPAKNDLDDIYDYIALTDGRPATAEGVVRGIHEACQRYADGPSQGEARSDFGDNYRVGLYKRWVIIYRPIEDGIEILRLVDGSRDFSRLFG